MVNLFKHYIFFVVLCFNFTACATDAKPKKIEIYDSWKLEKIVYADKSINELEPGNFVQIHKNYILEIMKGYGERRYSYTKQGKILDLAAENETVIWKITRHNANELQIETPIGLYILTR